MQRLQKVWQYIIREFLKIVYTFYISKTEKFEKTPDVFFKIFIFPK